MFSLLKWIDQVSSPKPLIKAELDSNEYFAGQAIGLTIRLHPDPHKEYGLIQISAKLICEISDHDDSFANKPFTLAEKTLENQLFLNQQDTQDFYLFQLPFNCPCSGHSAKFSLVITATAENNEQEQHTYPINIQLPELSQAFINTLTYLGFEEDMCWFNHNKSFENHTFPYLQKFKYLNATNPNLPDKMTVIFYFENFSDYVDIYMQVHASNHSLQYNISNHRFTVSHPNIEDSAVALLTFLQNQLTETV
ncbi:sporulation protein [Catenovulum sp. 2E275]|uniref:sporulation protein n=1 Tax=Catenovulum sp. 2E275 TaxID=2980497 RepID=UPI0021D2BC71|nr:sporulation protein [Catenovulum sp. 2E275]MCU4674838.1 sporulation protein [Catenovulum sp. 2E275]